MDDEANTPGESAIDSPTLDRRQLLRAGAWAAPVVLIAAATPAAAASVTVAQLGFTYFEASYVWGYNPDVFLGIRGSTSVSYTVNSGPAPALTSVTLTLRVRSQGMLAQPPTASTVVDEKPGVWTAGAGSVNGGIATYLFTWAGELSANKDTANLVFSLPGNEMPRPDVDEKNNLISLASTTAPGVAFKGQANSIGGFTATQGDLVSPIA